MGRPATGAIDVEERIDGTLAFRLRFRAHGRREQVYLHERRDCDCGCGGGWTVRTARVELRNIVAPVRAGAWTKPKRRSREAEQQRMSDTPTFHEYASYWLQAMHEGILGGKPLEPNTYLNYRWRLTHLLGFFAPYRLDEIDRDLCLEFKTREIQEAHRLREAIDAGADLREHTNKLTVPLSLASIKKEIDLLATVLDEAVEDGYLPVNPARNHRISNTLSLAEFSPADTKPAQTHPENRRAAAENRPTADTKN